METMFGEINVMGLCSIILFYLLILGVGMWAARKKSDVEGVSEEVKSLIVIFSSCFRHQVLIIHEIENRFIKN